MSDKSSFNPLDPMGLLKNFDPMKLMEEFQQQMSRFGMPGSNALLDGQRKNLEALMQANQLLMQSTQNLLQRQAELLTQANREAATVLNGLTAGNPAELPQKQAELISQAYGRAINNLHEATEMINQAHQQALQVLDRRWRESIEELKNLSSGKS